MPSITGQHFIGSRRSVAGSDTYVAENSATGEKLPGTFTEGTVAEVDECLQLAEAAFDALQTASVETIATLLETIATGIEALGDELLARAQAETALPMPRLQGERGRATGQARLFAKLIREGTWLQARIDRGDSTREPMPKPDVRTMYTAVGPVVVFGASNFPFAISVAGTDTVAALAARCPVIVKAHAGHPGTSELIAGVIADAVAAAGLPAGTFSMIHGHKHDVGTALVKHPLTAAVAFTGSTTGGRALMDVAAKRPAPIPVYAEMGSTNPVFLLPGALRERGPQIAQALIQSVNMGVGQFCTSPGVVLGVAGSELQSFLDATATGASATPPATMLHAGIHKSFDQGVERLANTARVERLSPSIEEGHNQAACTIFTAPYSLLDQEPDLTDEVFGPTSIVFQCDSTEQMLDYAKKMDGTLTANIHGTPEDLANHSDLIRLLERKAGRLIFNGFGTGIEVCAAMHHGGPYPSTSHSGFTSIGHAAIYRYVKPTCFQNFPDATLPPELQNANPRQITRLVDGQLSAAAIS